MFVVVIFLNNGEDLLNKHCLYKTKLDAFDMECKETNFVNMDADESIILAFDKAFSEDVCMIDRPELLGKLLAKMNSAQIRQFVCPFNKQFDIFSKIPSVLPRSRPSSRKDSSRMQNANINSFKNKSRCRRPVSQMENRRNNLLKIENGHTCLLDLRCRRPVSQMENRRNNVCKAEKGHNCQIDFRCKRPVSQMESRRNNLFKIGNCHTCHLELKCRRPVSQLENGRNNLFKNENEEKYKNQLAASKSTGDLRRK